MTGGHPRVILGKRGANTTEFWQRVRARAAARARRILLPEGEDPRVVSAAEFLVKEKIAVPLTVGNPERIRSIAQEIGADLRGVEIVNPSTDEKTSEYAHRLYERRKAKGMTEEQAERWTADPLYWGALALAAGRVDGCVGGAVRTTADTVRAGFAALGMAKGADTVFGAFLMECPHATGGLRRLVMADAAVSPRPSTRGLAAVGVGAAAFGEFYLEETPRVAYLSFSTLGSAEDEDVTLVRDAVALARKKAPALSIDGEWQADTALVDHIAHQKGATGPNAGRANVLVFPNLNAGNIGYKLVQHLGGARAVGPFLVGLANPMADLSRGCTDEDIVDTAAVTTLAGEAK